MTIDEQVKDLRYAYDQFIHLAIDHRDNQMVTISGTTMPAGSARAARAERFAKIYEGIIAVLQQDRERQIAKLEKKRK